MDGGGGAGGGDLGGSSEGSGASDGHDKGSLEDKNAKGSSGSGATKQFTTTMGKQVTVSGESYNKCVESCKTAPELKDSGGAIGALGALGGGESKNVADCITFCKHEFELFCFPGDSTVVVRNRGRVPISELHVGDMALSLRGWEGDAGDGELRFDRVLAFIHHEPNVEGEVLQIRHALGQVQLTPNHLLFVQRRGAGGIVPTLAAEVQVGDRVLAPWIDGGLSTPEVIEIKLCRKRGFFAPLLAGGTLLVDGTAASCYAIPRNLSESSTFRLAAQTLGSAGVHAMCHASFLPLRLLCQAALHQRSGLALASKEPEKLLQAKEATHPGGVHLYAWVLYVATSSLVS